MKGSSQFRSLCRILTIASLLVAVVSRSPAQITEPPVYPLTVSIVSPTNGAVFAAPTNIQITADLKDYGAYPDRIAFYAGTNLLVSLIMDPIGPSETNGLVVPVQYTWSNVPVGAYTLTAVATDTRGTTVTSAPVNITVTSSTPPVPTVTIVATDPIASVSGDPGTFTVYRTGPSSSVSNSLTVFYSIGGTASNGVDYVTLPNNVIIPAGASSAQITVTPINDSALDGNETVILQLTQPPYDSSIITYLVGSPSNAVVTILGNLPPTVGIVFPTNGATFTAPANIQILAKASDPGGFVRTVQFFAGTNSLGIVTNHPIVPEPLTPAATDGSIVYPINLFSLLWSNVLAGSYTLTAVATDSSGVMATSAPVNITVTTNPPPPPTNIPPVVAIESPTNGQKFLANANIQICASALDVDGFVTTVQFFAGTNSLGIVTNYPILVADTPGSGLPPFHMLCLTWSNVPPGAYTLTAVATDNGGATGTSAPVNITVITNLPPPTNIPPVVAIETPLNGAVFEAPANIPVVAYAHDPDGYVRTVQFFAGTKSLGIVTNIPIVVDPPVSPAAGIVYPVTTPFHILWSGVAAGSYTLTAVATDNDGASTTSAPVNITVTTSTVPPVVTIIATDPIASVCTNFPCVMPATAFANYCGGTNTATFLVRRAGDTNHDLTVDYSIGGTASNGVDYVTLPGYVTIPSGQRYSLITIVPRKAIHASAQPFLTVILALTEPPPPVVTPPPYIIGWPGKAEAIIFQECNVPWPVTGILPDTSFHVCLPGTNGMNFCLQISTNLIDWIPLCTNTVVKGAVEFVDPEATTFSKRYYRAVPVPGPAVY